MKKVVLIALGATVLVGCNSVPEKPEVAQLSGQSESVVFASPVVENNDVVAVVAPEPVVVSEPEVVVAQVKVVESATEAKPAATAFVAPEPTAVPVVSAQAKALDPRMDKIVKLINTSSGAKQVMSSDNPKAHEYHAKAKALYDQALHAGDKTEASRLLNESVKAMYTAIRSASREDVMAEKHQTDYQKLKRSVDTFLEQHERISDEKGAGSEGSALRAQVNTVVAEADKAFASKQYGIAQQLLRESFEMLRNSIESMREGETLVRSLNFATKKDEYDYELERYKSQLVLVDVLLKEKRKSSAYVAKQVDKYIGVAEEARGKAETAASTGDHHAAIELLEGARKQIVRALRTGGIYVPG
ncbi:MAG: hypothetical protein V7752_13500 [Halopseudomonas sp.]